jgi:hypothetical protein
VFDSCSDFDRFGRDLLGREHRFLPTRVQIDALARKIATAPLPPEERAVAPATINWTTYLDTDDLRYLRSFDGPIARRLRIREYQEDVPGSGGGPARRCCYLELKQTMDTRRSKIRVAGSLEMILGLIVGASERVGAPPPPPIPWSSGDPQWVALRILRQELASGCFRPRVGTWYRRSCLANGPRLRVTLDENLTFFEPAPLGDDPRPDPTRPLALGPALVLEVKHDGQLPSWLGQALEGLAEVHDFSKFRLGMSAVQGITPFLSRPTDNDNENEIGGPHESELARHSHTSVG